MLSMAEATLRYRVQDIMQNTGMLYWGKKELRMPKQRLPYLRSPVCMQGCSGMRIKICVLGGRGVVQKVYVYKKIKKLIDELTLSQKYHDGFFQTLSIRTEECVR
jgi:hypothetical protein